jgi:hypothetical protein
VKRALFAFIVTIGTVNGAEGPVTFNTNIVRYYGDAPWVCRDFERMDAATFITSWCQLVALVSNAEQRWFYWSDDQKCYQKLEEQRYSTLSRYLKESLEVQWVNECRAYDTFLMTHTIDKTSGALVQCETKERDYQQEGQQITVLDTLCQLVPEQVFSFYAFFFEQLSNVLLRTTSYAYDDSEYADDMNNISEYSRLFSVTYTICTHRVRAGTPAQLQLLTKHYERVPSVMTLAALEKIKAVYGEEACAAV